MISSAGARTTCPLGTPFDEGPIDQLRDARTAISCREVCSALESDSDAANLGRIFISRSRSVYSGFVRSSLAPLFDDRRAAEGVLQRESAIRRACSASPNGGILSQGRPPLPQRGPGSPGRQAPQSGWACRSHAEWQEASRVFRAGRRIHVKPGAMLTIPAALVKVSLEAPNVGYNRPFLFKWHPGSALEDCRRRNWCLDHFEALKKCTLGTAALPPRCAEGLCPSGRATRSCQSAFAVGRSAPAGWKRYRCLPWVQQENRVELLGTPGEPAAGRVPPGLSSG